MPVQLNHTIVHARDTDESSTFVAEILGLAPPRRFGPFLVVELDNGVSLDFMHGDDDERIIEHYAFLVGERDFDEIFGRIQARGLPYWSDPMRTHAGEINHHDGGRGVYFEDPSGNVLEIITRPYGSGS